MKPQPIPPGYSTITPYYTVEGAAAFLDFLKAAFGAEVVRRHDREDGGVGNAELRIGTSMIMVSDARDPWKPMPMSAYLYVEDADAVYRAAMAAGAASLYEPTDMFYGDRSGGAQDAWGNVWWIGTRIEDVSEEELLRRMKEQA
ncbi:MAG TPA: VOC family protein [Holophagaceae bacterium]|jgi:PhnB protein|nr:VOC family protein [Holophagaceae bacterium]